MSDHTIEPGADATVINAPTIGLKTAHQLVSGAVQAAQDYGVATCIAIVDRAGHLLAFSRMDGAPLLCIQLAQDKAHTVAVFRGLPTHDWWDQLDVNPAVQHGLAKADRFTAIGGGLPVTMNGEVVGAIGVSGGNSPEQDRLIAEAAVELIYRK